MIATRSLGRVRSLRDKQLNVIVIEEPANDWKNVGGALTFGEPVRSREMNAKDGLLNLKVENHASGGFVNS